MPNSELYGGLEKGASRFGRWMAVVLCVALLAFSRGLAAILNTGMDSVPKMLACVAWGAICILALVVAFILLARRMAQAYGGAASVRDAIRWTFARFGTTLVTAVLLFAWPAGLIRAVPAVYRSNMDVGLQMLCFLGLMLGPVVILVSLASRRMTAAHRKGRTTKVMQRPNIVEALAETNHDDIATIPRESIAWRKFLWAANLPGAVNEAEAGLVSLAFKKGVVLAAIVCFSGAVQLGFNFMSGNDGGYLGFSERAMGVFMYGVFAMVYLATATVERWEPMALINGGSAHEEQPVAVLLHDPVLHREISGGVAVR